MGAPFDLLLEGSDHRTIIVVQLLLGFVDIEFTEEGLETARTASIRHIEERGNEYVEAWSISVDSGTRTYDAVYRSNQPNRRTLEANRHSGIYLILDRDTNRAYVGLTNNFSDRFFNGKPTHPRGCRQDCRCHGHITVTLETCTSHNIINTDSNSGYSVHIIDRIPYKGDQIGQAEIEWYYILREHGYEMVNAVWMLGKKGYIGRPIISLDIKKQRYHYFPSISEAANTLLSGKSGGAGSIGPILVKTQNQKWGFTHRYATLSEVRGYSEDVDVATFLSGFDREMVWRRRRTRTVVNLETTCLGCSGTKALHSKSFQMYWDSGVLNQIEIQHLIGTGRGSYDPTPKTKFKQVSWDKTRQGWQTRWKKTPGSSMTNLGRAGPRNEWKKPIQLAIHREDEILKNDYQEHCTGKTGSNAKRINFHQPWRFFQGNYYVDWGDNKTGCVRVIAVYGGLLSLMSLILLQLIV